MSEALHIRLLERGDIEPIVAAMRADPMWANDQNKTHEQYARYLEEQHVGLRVTHVAFLNKRFAGYLNVIWNPDYAPFRKAGIPEVNDFNVLTACRRCGIGTRLMDAAEATIAERSKWAGIGVGMPASYGPAQILYVRRGYVPDGNGLTHRNRILEYGDTPTVDDDLALYLVKDLEA